MAGPDQLAYYHPPETRETTLAKERPEPSEEELFRASRETKKREFAKGLLEFADYEERFGNMDEYAGVLTPEEIEGLIGKNEKNRYTLIASLSDHIDVEWGLSPQEVEQVTALKEVLREAWEILKDIIVPEWYEVPLIALPIAQEAVVAERLTRMGLAVEKLLPQIERVKKIGNFWEKGIQAIDNALELAKQWDLSKLKAIIRLLVKTKSPEKIQAAAELAKVKKEVQLIKIEWRTAKEWVEASGKYEAINYLIDNNLNRLFSRGHPRYREIRNELLEEVVKMEKRHNAVKSQGELEWYVDEFKSLLKSHKMDPWDLKNLEDIKRFLINNP